jgi:hypothetical protein
LPLPLLTKSRRMSTGGLKKAAMPDNGDGHESGAGGEERKPAVDQALAALRSLLAIIIDGMSVGRRTDALEARIRRLERTVELLRDHTERGGEVRCKEQPSNGAEIARLAAAAAEE